MNTELQKDDFNYGGLFRGSVLYNNDPLKLGRVKVNVFGVYTDISVDDLPWAAPMQPVGPGAGSGYGVFSVPEVGSMVFVMFEGGDIYQPVYIGSAPDGVHGLPSDRITSYPSKKVIKTKNGIVIHVDDSALEVKITLPSGTYLKVGSEINVNHASGAYIKIDASGNITIQGTKVDINP